MTLLDAVERDAPTLAFIGSTRGETLTEIGFKLHCVRALLTRFQIEQELSREELLIAVEDFEPPFSENRMIEVAVKTGLVTPIEEGRFKLSPSVALHQLFPGELRARRVDIPLDAYRRFAVTHTGVDPADQNGQPPRVDPEFCLSAIQRSWAWALELIMYCLDHDLPGIPVFWPCEGPVHRPLGQDVGTMSTLATMQLVASPSMYGFAAADYRALLASPIVLDFIELLLRLQRKESGWFSGAFAVEDFDDDFVGAWLPPAQCPDCPPGPCPTVDGTAVALRLFSQVYSSGLFDEPVDPRRAGLREQLVAAIGEAVQFLLRTQLDNGTWGIYRYEEDVYPVRQRELSSRYAVEGLAEAVQTGILDSTITEQLAQAIAQYVAVVEATANDSEAGTYWTPDFTTKAGEVGVAERFLSTLWVTYSLLAVEQGWSALRPGLAPRVDAGIRYLLSDWIPDVERFVSVDVRVPTWKGTAVTPFSWELPTDPLMVSLLFAHQRSHSAPIPDDVWVKMKRAIANFLADERHGHWIDFLMRREGDERAMAVNTLYYSMALLDYLHHLHGAVDKMFDGQS